LKQRVRQMWFLLPIISGSEHHFQEKKWCRLHWRPIQIKPVQSFASIVFLGYEIIHDTSVVLFLRFTFDWVRILEAADDSVARLCEISPLTKIVANLIKLIILN
jgi:hypothetical protein